jgi:alkylated DNA repair dioxygenase AlkB
MQPSLFADEMFAMPGGWRFATDFLSSEEENELLQSIERLTLVEAQYKQYTARRRVASFGGKFDYDSNRLRPAPDIPDSLLGIRARIANWLSIDPAKFQQMLVAQYTPGTPLGWHRDVPEFESIVGISLKGNALMKFRPYPPPTGRSSETLQLDLPPRSVYVMEADARWKWQHSIAPTKELRYSISLRTMRGTPLLLRA